MADHRKFAALMARIHAVFGIGPLSELTIEEYWQALHLYEDNQLELAWNSIRRNKLDKGMPTPAVIHEHARLVMPLVTWDTRRPNQLGSGDRVTPPAEARKRIAEMKAKVAKAMP